MIVNRAFKEIDRLCDGGRWTMTIPVRDTDSDVVISGALESLLDRIEAVRDLINNPQTVGWIERDGVTAWVSADAVRRALEGDSNE